MDAVTTAQGQPVSAGHEGSYKRSFFCVIAGALLLVLAGCEPIVRTTMSVANRTYDAKEAERSRQIYESSVARYQAMADGGDPKGLYYMAIVHAVNHLKDPDGDVLTVKRLYEEAIEKGSNDAKVALGEMLVTGDTMPYAYSHQTLPANQRDPRRGLELLKVAAEKSCSYTEPLIGISMCREREASIPSKVWVIYRDGWGGISKDIEQEKEWKSRRDACEPIIKKVNQERHCYE